MRDVGKIDSNREGSISSNFDVGVDREIEHLKQGIRQLWQSNRAEALILADRLMLLRQEHTLTSVHIRPNLIVMEADRIFTDRDYLYQSEFSYEMANEIGNYFYRQIDLYRYRDIETAIKYGHALVQFGKSRFDKSLIGLGLTGLGEAKAAQGSDLNEACTYLTQAQDLFIEDGNVIGWAKTIAAQVFIAIEVNRTDESLRDAGLAREILLKYQEHKATVTLIAALMKVYKDLGRFQQIIELYHVAHPLALGLGIDGEFQVAVLNNNVGQAYLYSGQLFSAKTHFTAALDMLTRLEKDGACRVVQFNLAYIELFLGNYQHALEIAYAILEAYEREETVSIHVVHIKMQIAECYLHLNKNKEMAPLAQEVLDHISQLGGELPHETANIYRYLAIAQVELGELDLALKNFDRSERVFADLDTQTWQYDVTAWRGEVAYRQNKYKRAVDLAERVLNIAEGQQTPNYSVRAWITQGKAYLELGQFEAARHAARRAVHLSRQSQIPSSRYKGHILLGKIAHRKGEAERARRHFMAASLIIQQIQKQLTISLQRDFWEDKSDVLNSLMKIDLEAGNTVEAFHTLERSKSQVLLTYLANRKRHQWLKNEAESEKLLNLLSELRQQHHFYYRLVHEPEQLDEEVCFQVGDPATILKRIERQLLVVTERLYINSAAQTPFNASGSIKLEKIQAAIRPDELLLEYYSDGTGWSMFVISNDFIESIQLDIDSNRLIKLIEKLQFNLRCAADSSINAAMRNHLYKTALKLGQKLYDGLIRPAAPFLENSSRLTIVPFGLLHYLPFNAFYDGQQFLIERVELVTLPAAGLKLQQPIQQAPSALVMAHSNGGMLPHTLKESQAIAALINGEVMQETSVTRERFTRPASQILHLAAHGKHRIDQPNLSYIQLADGQLFPDDLLQGDLQYELVVLSACETGRAVVKEGEELVGLSQVVLCAGAGALVASQWQVEDRITSDLMRKFYEELMRGSSKAAALRQAQIEILSQVPNLHPLFWAPFQLVGNPAPLSHLTQSIICN